VPDWVAGRHEQGNRQQTQISHPNPTDHHYRLLHELKRFRM
jgi:hypothetical protein